MKTDHRTKPLRGGYILLLAFCSALSTAAAQVDTSWQAIRLSACSLHFTSADQTDVVRYRACTEQGIRTVRTFFDTSFPARFDVFVHPDRASLDSTWQKDWGAPDFHSACWMVASGVAAKLDLLSPRQWRQMACEHQWTDTLKSQQLITHELVHVYHGQHNGSPDFSQTSGIDWLVEGLAVYASGQCDSARIVQVKQQIQQQKSPALLDQFWTGTAKYGLSGSMVWYIDQRFGRPTLKQLLPQTQLPAVLNVLQVTESDLIEGWKVWVQGLK